MNETELYDFMGWLTTRKDRLVLSSNDDAAPAAEAVAEYIRTFPERLARQSAPQPEAEPVAEVVCDVFPTKIGDVVGELAACAVLHWNINRTNMPVGTKLYAHPPAQAVPDGFVLVPKLVTDAMRAAADRHRAEGRPIAYLQELWERLLSAAPKPGEKEGGE